jgi:hypothetical protein
MSDKKQILIIEPSSGTMQERAYFYGFTCPACAGVGYLDFSGWMKKFKKEPTDPDWQQCVSCAGTGRLRAEVEVIWKSDGLNKNRK